ncbi:uncharacterized protein [Palaemon carinicauda]|uniref:uncharacterized protein n=1 Tax=Palaemon carinicauda TaxID=392227 RepID=UPI0035B61DA4
MRGADRELRKETHVTTRRADKTAAFFLIDPEEYHSKLNLILGDSSKFEKLSYNPIEEIKREANKTNEKINAATNAVHIQTITEDFSPGHLYGNVNTHKNGHPLRHIISQCPTPTYHLAKRINSLLTPYIPYEYGVASSTKFLSRLKRSPTNGTIAPLVVESLLTNVPAIETLRKMFDECSCLRFTDEHSKDGRLPFLDVLISPNPTRYKAFTIKAYVRRALSHCSSLAATH